MAATTIDSTDEAAQRRAILNGMDTSLPFSLNALKVLAKRYLLRTHEGAVTETPEQMFRRVARALAGVEQQYGASSDAVRQLEDEFYDAMSGFYFLPAGRTLANAGGPTRLVSNCVVLHIEDSMPEIMETLKDAVLLQKAGSGIGFPFHLLRPAGAVTKTSYGIASGPVSFLRAFDCMFSVIKQQNRHGANMAVMSVEHPDVLEFIVAKNQEGTLRNFNCSVGLTDRFMKAVRDNDPSPWMCQFDGIPMLPRRVHRDSNGSFVSATEVRMTARQIFEEILDSAWRTGEPGCVFLDTVNAKNPLPGLGPIHASNPCGEQFLHDGDVCNLGALNLERFVTADGKSIDWPRLRHAVHALDNVVDLADFPVSRVSQTARNNRRIGLGIMGFADMLYRLEIAYNSDEGRRVASEVMAFIQRCAEEKSCELGESKGVFHNWEKSVFYPHTRRRNAALTNVPPTGTISLLFDVSGGVEPHFALAYFYKNVLGGQSLSYVNKHLRRALEAHGACTEEVLDEIVRRGSLQHLTQLPESLRRTFVTAMDISTRDHILMQAALQKHCDNAISKTCNAPNHATREDFLQAYLMAWEHGCKGCTVYRDGSRQEQVLNLYQPSAQPSAQQPTPLPMATSVPAGAPIAAAGNNESSEADRHAAEKRAAWAEAGAAAEAVLAAAKKRRTDAERLSNACPDCRQSMVQQEGCYSCRACGFSKCAL